MNSDLHLYTFKEHFQFHSKNNKKMAQLSIAIGADHAGFQLKTAISEYVLSLGHKVEDFGCASEASVDYPDFAHPVANAVESGKANFGILICGSGNGINMTVNKHQGVRSALCWNTEIAVLARHHNNANICSLPARFITESEAKKIVDVFLKESFDGGRHFIRVEKIPILPK